MILSKQSANHSATNIGLFLQQNTNRLTWFSADGQGSLNQFETTTSITAGKFNHVAVTIKGAAITLYINGAVGATNTLVGQCTATDGLLVIGDVIRRQQS